MEMEIRAKEAIEMGEDIISPLSPLTSALHDSFLFSHCSSCFSPLSPLPLLHINSLHYCSTKCFDSNAAIAHFISSTHHLPFPESADLRAAFRLLHLTLSNPSAFLSPERVFGLLTNRENLMNRFREDDDDEICVRIRKGADAMAVSTRKLSPDVCEAILCLILTNAVEVLNSDGRAIGIAVYDSNFCWINHSCSPNSCYRFLISPPAVIDSYSNDTMLRVVPHAQVQNKSTGRSDLTNFITADLQEYGPRIVVRSTKSIKEGEAVTIAYCDLLQPKAMRQSELWSRYQFVCCCQRCSVQPLTYVDHALQEIYAAKVDLFDSASASNFCLDDALRRINDYVENTIAEYLSIGSPESCCEKLENMLTSGFCDEQIEDSEGKQPLNLRLNPLHHLSLNAYTALASAYKVRSSYLSASNSRIDECTFDAFSMSRTSAAYSLLLAGATHHLFLSEHSLIASAANSWVFSGESLINLSRSSLWTNFSKQSVPISNLYHIEKRVCSKCSCIGKLSASRIHSQVLIFELQEFSTEFYNCVANISQKTWCFLTHGCSYLKAFRDPFDCSNFLGYNNNTQDIVSNCEEPQESCGEMRLVIFQLGIHCLLYGGYLASTCYGHHSHLASLIQSVLDEIN